MSGAPSGSLNVARPMTCCPLDRSLSTQSLSFLQKYLISATVLRSDEHAEGRFDVGPRVVVAVLKKLGEGIVAVDAL
jgi:hypothetical protein